MSKSPKLSGAQIIRVLIKEFGFSFAGQSGSHVKLRKFVGGRKVVTIVPLHREVKTGTLFGILELAEIKKDEFLAEV